jgi:sterol 3beta-glucosyltransferase
LVLEINEKFSLKLVFRTQESRDEAIARISDLINGSPTKPGTITPSTSIPLSESPPKSLKTNATGLFSPLSRSLTAAATVGIPAAIQSRLPKAINLPQAVLLSMPPMHFVCLTIGSRGDVQPYIALGLGLKKEGHRVTIATHEEYKSWIQGFGIEHRTTGGDPGALMKLSVENRVCCIPLVCRYFMKCFVWPDVFSRIFQGESFKGKYHIIVITEHIVTVVSSSDPGWISVSA